MVGPSQTPARHGRPSASAHLTPLYGPQQASPSRREGDNDGSDIVRHRPHAAPSLARHLRDLLGRRIGVLGAARNLNSLLRAHPVPDAIRPKDDKLVAAVELVRCDLGLGDYARAVGARVDGVAHRARGREPEALAGVPHARGPRKAAAGHHGGVNTAAAAFYPRALLVAVWLVVLREVARHHAPRLRVHPAQHGARVAHVRDEQLAPALEGGDGGGAREGDINAGGLERVLCARVRLRDRPLRRLRI
mmetsp:Transcript_66409/g.176803  ORF Transcript_66409/g.176803 Transcript_66409/m.176803 type:complete len:248 (-) Transcript_66409:152-895(-)